MKYYYITFDLGEGIPTYDFCVKAMDETRAEKEAIKILEQDYPEEFSQSRRKDFSYEQITAEQLLTKMTLN